MARERGMGSLQLEKSGRWSNEWCCQKIKVILYFWQFMGLI